MRLVVFQEITSELIRIVGKCLVNAHVRSVQFVYRITAWFVLCLGSGTSLFLQLMQETGLIRLEPPHLEYRFLWLARVYCNKKEWAKEEC